MNEDFHTRLQGQQAMTTDRLRRGGKNATTQLFAHDPELQQDEKANCNLKTMFNAAYLDLITEENNMRHFETVAPQWFVFELKMFSNYPNTVSFSAYINQLYCLALKLQREEKSKSSLIAWLLMKVLENSRHKPLRITTVNKIFSELGLDVLPKMGEILEEAKKKRKRKRTV